MEDVPWLPTLLARLGTPDVVEANPSVVDAAAAEEALAADALDALTF